MFEPKYNISPQLLNTLKNIAVLVNDLNKRVTDEKLFYKLAKEASIQSSYASTTIEGNPLGLTAVKDLIKNSAKNIDKTQQEVVNYNKAIQEYADSKFNETTVQNIHKAITNKLLLKEKSGKYRKEPVFIYKPLSAEIVFLPPDHKDLSRLMKDLYSFIESNKNLDAVILAGIFHKQFVLIHPFIDGNGRTARLATTLVLKNLGINLFKLLSFENYYNANISKYFEMVGERGNYYELEPDFTAWLEYFALGIETELLRLVDTLNVNQKQTLRLQKHHKIILDYLKEHAAINDRDYSKLVERAKSTRALDFAFLTKAKLIERKARGPATYYILVDE